mmetsp:Transcript_19411/g.41045  ORF Transcript_19411/g.41045 Transcript_19411/m.41045 type:complete len:258 (-) Transcript_19411:229-1002(-)
MADVTEDQSKAAQPKAAQGAPPPEEPAARPTLHSVVIERLKRLNRPLQPINRICLVGKATGGGGAKAVASFFERNVRSVGDAIDTSSLLTGMLLQLPTGWLCLMEGALASLSVLLSALHKESKCEDASVGEMKVICIMDDVGDRTFSRWTHTTLDVSRNNYMELDKSGPAMLLSDVTIGALKVLKTLDSLSYDETSTALADWQNRFRTVMPSNERLQQILEIDEVPSLEDFVAIYETPSDATFISDRVWPPAKPLVY